jgi:IS5 family transposase
VAAEAASKPSVAPWGQNPSWQFFCGGEDFQWARPCDPSDLVYFRQRIGEDGVAVIFAASAQMHGKKAARRRKSSSTRRCRRRR